MSDYDTDLLTWSEHQALLLRRLAAGEQVNDQVDWSNIAEEIESLGKSDRRELRNRIATLLVHLLKLQTSPATGPRAGWYDTVLEQRQGIRSLLRDSPSLRPTISDVIAEEIVEARSRAARTLADYGESTLVHLAILSFTEEQVLGPWLP